MAMISGLRGAGFCRIARPCRLGGTRPGDRLPHAVLIRSWSASTPSSDDEQRLARQWRATFNRDAIPRQICEVTFSRASGPGGQHVNKYSKARRIHVCAALMVSRTESKATLRADLSDLRGFLPPIVYEQLRRSRYVAARSNSILMQADGSRRQNDNLESCYRKLYQAIIEAADEVIAGETSAEQAKRVQKL